MTYGLYTLAQNERVAKSVASNHTLCDLVGRAQLSDVAAISELYSRYASSILRYVAIRVYDYELAQDLTQEVFIRVIKGIESFEYRDEKAFLGWLYTIASNVLSTHHRRRRVVSTSLDTHSEVVDRRTQDDARAVCERVALQQAMRQLTNDQQRVLALRFFADMTNAEIARTLGRSEGAVKAVQYRALQSLQKILSRDVEEQAHQPIADVEQSVARQGGFVPVLGSA